MASEGRQRLGSLLAWAVTFAAGVAGLSLFSRIDHIDLPDRAKRVITLGSFPILMVAVAVISAALDNWTASVVVRGFDSDAWADSTFGGERVFRSVRRAGRAGRRLRGE